LQSRAYDTEPTKKFVRDKIDQSVEQGEKVCKEASKKSFFALIPIVLNAASSILQFVGAPEFLYKPLSSLQGKKVEECSGPTLDKSAKATCGVVKKTLHKSADKSIDYSAPHFYKYLSSWFQQK